MDFSIPPSDENATLMETTTVMATDYGWKVPPVQYHWSNGVSVGGTATVETGDDNNGNNGNGGNNGGGGNNQEPDIPQRDEPESDEDRRFAFQLSLYAGWNFVHIPLEVTQVNGRIHEH